MRRGKEGHMDLETRKNRSQKQEKRRSESKKLILASNRRLARTCDSEKGNLLKLPNLFFRRKAEISPPTHRHTHTHASTRAQAHTDTQANTFKAWKVEGERHSVSGHLLTLSRGNRERQAQST